LTTFQTPLISTGARQKLGPEHIEVRTSGMPATTTWKLLEENLQ
jgi:hypothetical protein